MGTNFKSLSDILIKLKKKFNVIKGEMWTQTFLKWKN